MSIFDFTLPQLWLLAAFVVIVGHLFGWIYRQVCTGAISFRKTLFVVFTAMFVALWVTKDLKEAAADIFFLFLMFWQMQASFEKRRINPLDFFKPSFYREPPPKKDGGNGTFEA